MIAEFLNQQTLPGPSSGEIRCSRPVPGITVYDGCLTQAADPEAGPFCIPKSAGRFSSAFREALLCRSGRMQMMKDGRSIFVGPGDVLLAAPCAEPVQVKLFPGRFGFLSTVADSQDSPEPFHALCALFPILSDAVARLHTLSEKHSGCLLLHDNGWSSSVLSALEQTSGKYRGFCFLLRLMELLCLSAEQDERISEDPFSSESQRYFDPFQMESVRMAHDYMLEHCDQKLTVRELAARFRLSSTTFKTCFRQLYGEPVHSYLSRYRLERAAFLLHTTSDSILSIGLAVGYAGSSHFGAAFREAYHMSPSEYRKAYSGSSSASS